MTKLIVAFRDFAKVSKKNDGSFETLVPIYQTTRRHIGGKKAYRRGTHKFPFQPRRKTQLFIALCNSDVCHSFVLGKITREMICSQHNWCYVLNSATSFDFRGVIFMPVIYDT
jgi:hypothetical protein